MSDVYIYIYMNVYIYICKMPNKCRMISCPRYSCLCNLIMVPEARRLPWLNHQLRPKSAALYADLGVTSNMCDHLEDGVIQNT